MRKNVFYALTAVLCWSTLAPVAKKILADIPNLQALAASSFLAFLALLILNIATGSIRKFKDYTAKQYAVMAALGFIGLFVYTALYYFGLARLRAQEACILNYLWPMMLVVFSCIILKERMTFMKGVAMVCSFIGIIILSLGGDGVPADSALFGIISCIVAAACYGLFSVLNKKFDFDQGVSMTVFWFVTAICSFILGPVTESWVSISLSQWAGLAWLGVVVYGIAYLLWALALKGIENTAKIANLAYLTPFLSLITSKLFLDEDILPQAFIALAFIIGGILLQSFYDRKKSK